MVGDPVASTTDLAVAAWLWVHGLEFLRCIAQDRRRRAAFEFDDPQGLAPELKREFHRTQALHEFLNARRRLLFLAQVAAALESGVATLGDIDVSTRHLGPALAAAAARATGRVIA